MHILAVIVAPVVVIASIELSLSFILPLLELINALRGLIKHHDEPPFIDRLEEYFFTN